MYPFVWQKKKDIHDITNGLICTVLFIVGLIYTCIKNKDVKAAVEPLKSIDFETIGLLLGLFLPS